MTSLADEGSSVYYNPAGLARLEWQELSAMHASLFEGTIWDFGSWVYPIGDRTASVSALCGWGQMTLNGEWISIPAGHSGTRRGSSPWPTGR